MNPVPILLLFIAACTFTGLIVMVVACRRAFKAAEDGAASLPAGSGWSEISLTPPRLEVRATTPDPTRPLTWGDPIRIGTGDLDDAEGTELVMFWGGNGDFYIGTAPAGSRDWRLVQIVMSGGHNTLIPSIAGKLAELYQTTWRHCHCHPNPALTELQRKWLGGTRAIAGDLAREFPTTEH